MATLFLPTPSDAWCARELSVLPMTLIPDPLDVVPWEGDGWQGRQLPSVHRSDPSSGSAEFSLLAPRGCAVWVNQCLVTAGLRVLRHRDAIRIGQAPVLYFSTEQLARVEAFSASDGPAHCPRCCSEILPNDEVVRCPGCQVALHHMPAGGRGCFTYASTCCVCGGPTDFSAEYRWHPGSL